MTIAMFAIIGAAINAGVGYWILFGVYCACRLVEATIKVIEETK